MDGVSGLNVFTGIKSKRSQASYLESKAINPVPDGRQLSAPQVMLSAPGLGERNCEYIKRKQGRNRFLEKNVLPVMPNGGGMASAALPPPNKEKEAIFEESAKIQD